MIPLKPITPPKADSGSTRLGRLQNRLDGWTAVLDRLPLVVWLAICWFACLAAGKYLPVFWNANDDIAMANLANGRLTGAFEWQLVFINPLWGLLLKGLYSTTKSIPWYPVLFMTMHGFGWALFFRAAGLLSFGWQKWAWALFIWAGILFFGAMQLQFTSVAAFPAVSALLFTAAQVRRARGPGHLLKLVWPALLCLCLCWLIRKEAIFLVIAIAGPMVFWLLLVEKKSLKKLLVFGGIFAGFIACALVADRLSYAQDAWKYYRQYNYTRGALQDSKPVRYDAAPELIRNLGWSRNDYDLFYHFRQDRALQYSMDPIEKLFAFKGTLSDPEVLGVKVAKEWKDIQLAGYAWTWFAMAAIVLLVAGVRRKLDIAAVIGTVAFAAAVAAAFIVILILKDRVFICLLFQAVGACFFLRFYSVQKRSYQQLAFVAIAGGLAALSAKATLSQGLAVDRELKSNYVYLAKLQAPSATNPLIDFFSGSLAVNDPFFHYKMPQVYYKLAPIPIGWLTYSPFQAKAMRRVGYKPDSSLFLQAAGDPRATFLLDPLTGPMLQEYLREHLKKHVRFEPVSKNWDPATEKAVQYRLVNMNAD